MNSNAMIKATARQRLLGRYKLVIAALFVSQLVNFLLDLPFSNMTEQGMTTGAMSQLATGAAGSFVVSLVSILLGSGLCAIHLQIAKGKKAAFSQLLYPFKNSPNRFIVYGFLLYLVCAACLVAGCVAAFFVPVVGVVLLVAGGIVLVCISLSWSMTVFLLLEDDRLGALEAIRQSCRLMKGRKRKLLGLYLSFVGWLLFSVLTFFVGLLWIMPYLTQSLCGFYLDLKNNQ